MSQTTLAFVVIATMSFGAMFGFLLAAVLNNRDRGDISRD